VTPCGRLTLTNSWTHACRLGGQVRLDNRLLLNPEGTRQETAAQPVDHSLVMQIGLASGSCRKGKKDTRMHTMLVRTLSSIVWSFLQTAGTAALSRPSRTNRNRYRVHAE